MPDPHIAYADVFAELITPRACLARRYHVYTSHQGCNGVFGETFTDPRWGKHMDTPLAQRFARGLMLCQKGCGKPITRLRVERARGGASSHSDTILELTRDPT